MAVNALAKAGFTKVYNIIDGFEGDKVEDPESVYHGKRMRNGWKNAAPWTYELDPTLVWIPTGESWTHSARPWTFDLDLMGDSRAV